MENDKHTQDIETLLKEIQELRGRVSEQRKVILKCKNFIADFRLKKEVSSQPIWELVNSSLKKHK